MKSLITFLWTHLFLWNFNVYFLRVFLRVFWQKSNDWIKIDTLYKIYVIISYFERIIHYLWDFWWFYHETITLWESYNDMIIIHFNLLTNFEMRAFPIWIHKYLKSFVTNLTDDSIERITASVKTIFLFVKFVWSGTFSLVLGFSLCFLCSKLLLRIFRPWRKIWPSMLGWKKNLVNVVVEI